MIDRLIENGRSCGMEMKVKKKGKDYLKTTIPSTSYDRLKTTGECGIFQLFGQHDKWFTRYMGN
jgi:hypothetical protein